MTVRRLMVGLVLLAGLSVWSWCRADGTPDHPTPAGPVQTAEVADGSGGGDNREEALHRYRTNQARHWKHIMVGTH